MKVVGYRFQFAFVLQLFFFFFEQTFQMKKKEKGRNVFKQVMEERICKKPVYTCSLLMRFLNCYPFDKAYCVSNGFVMYFDAFNGFWGLILGVNQ